MRLVGRVLASCALTVSALLLGGAPASAARAPVPVPSGDFLVCEGAGHLSVLSPAGRFLGAVPGTTGPYCATGLALSTDRRSAYFSILRGDDAPPALERVDLATGATTELASGLDPALSPDGTKLAFIATAEAANGGYYTPTGLGILDLASAASRIFAAPTPTPSSRFLWPDGPLNWPPDGTKIAVFAGDQIRIVD